MLSAGFLSGGELMASSDQEEELLNNRGLEVAQIVRGIHVTGGD
jgi:hypothetical protein